MGLCRIVFLSHIFSGTAPVFGSTRDSRLSDVFHLIDAGKVGHLHTHLASFAQTQRGSMGSSDPCESYLSCECPYNPHDTYIDQQCSSRRFSIIQDILTNLVRTDSTTELSITSSISGLRDPVSRMQVMIDRIHKDTIDLGYNTSYAPNSSISEMEKLLPRTLNAEYRLARMTNNAWMNLINATNVFSKDVRHMMNMTRHIVRNITVILNAAQLEEEKLSFGYLKNATKLANDRLVDQTFQLNKVYQFLSGIMEKLEKEPTLDPDNVMDLADSLNNAAIDLKDRIERWLPDELNVRQQQSTNKLDQYFSRLVDSFNTKTAQGMNGIQMRTNTKIQTMTNSSGQSITAGAAVMSNTRKRIVSQFPSQLKPVENKLSKFEVASRNIFKNQLESLRDDLAQTLSAFAAQSDHGRSDLRSSMSSYDMLNQFTVDLKSSEARLKSAAISDFYTASSQANKTIGDILSQLPNMAQQSVLPNAQRIATGAIEAVGTSTMASLDNLQSASESATSTSADQARQSALASSQASNGLSYTAKATENQIDSYSDSVQEQIGSSMSAVLKSMGSNITSNSFGSNPSAQVAGELSDTNSRFQSMIDLANQGSVGGPSADAAASAQGGVDDLLSNLDNHSESFSSNIGGIREVLSGASIAGFGTTQLGVRTDQLTRNGIAGTSNNLANMESQFGDLFTNADQNMGTMSGGNGSPQSGISSFIADANGQLIQVQGKLDSGVLTTLDGSDVLEKSAGKTWSVSGDAFGTMRQTSEEIEGTEMENRANLDSAIARVARASSGSTESNLRDINDLSSSSSASISAVGPEALRKIRNQAALTDSVMQMVNNFLSKNNEKLFDQIQRLPQIVATKYVSKLNAKKSITETIRDDGLNQLNSMQISSLGESDSLLNKIRNLNISAINDIDSILSGSKLGGNEVVSQVAGQLEGLANHAKQRAEEITNSLKFTTKSVMEKEMETFGNQSVDLMNFFTNITNSILSGQTIIPESLLNSSSNILALVQGARNVVAGAANTTAAGSAAVGLANTAASSAAVRLNSIGSPASATEVADQQNSMSTLTVQQNLQADQVGNREKNLAYVAGDVSNVVSDLAAQARDQADYSSNSASAIYNSVIASKAAVNKVMGKILSSYVTNSTNLDSQTQGGVAEVSLQSKNLQRAIHALSDAFTAYLESQRTRYSESQSGMDTFNEAIILQTNEGFKSAEKSMDMNKDDLAVLLNRISSGWDDLRLANSAVNQSVTKVESQVSGLYDTSIDTIDNEREQIQELADTVKNDDTSTSVRNQVEGLVKRLAQNAIESIQSVGVDVPNALSEMLTESLEDMATTTTTTTTTTVTTTTTTVMSTTTVEETSTTTTEIPTTTTISSSPAPVEVSTETTTEIPTTTTELTTEVVTQAIID